MNERRRSMEHRATDAARAVHARLVSRVDSWCDAGAQSDPPWAIELDALEACAALVAAVPGLTVPHGVWRTRAVSAELAEDVRARVTISHLMALVRVAESMRAPAHLAGR